MPSSKRNNDTREEVTREEGSQWGCYRLRDGSVGVEPRDERQEIHEDS